jgi:hypothetical protein
LDGQPIPGHGGLRAVRSYAETAVQRSFGVRVCVAHRSIPSRTGLIAGSSLMFGAFIARRFVLRLEPDFL